MSLFGNFKNIAINLPGWHTRRKLVVIESDDWGSIRMPSREVYDRLLAKGMRVDRNPYTRYDCLESNDDLTALFEVLGAVKDQQGHPAVLTANTIMANPDFGRIAASGYQAYHYETIPTTLGRYPAHDRVWKLYHEGLAAGVYRPQLHGREHLNVTQWLRALQAGHPDFLEAFAHEAFGIIAESEGSKRNNFMAALDYESGEDEERLVPILQDAAHLFETAFGYPSATFIAPCYVWGGAKVEATLAQIGVRALQGIPYQYQPAPGQIWYQKRFRFTGQRNAYGQLQLVRNAFFEPSLAPNQDSVGECLKRVELAFACRKPAIIGSHRLNYIGGIHADNREKNLALLRNLLNSIVKKWPDVEFLSSDQLYKIIALK